VEHAALEAIAPSPVAQSDSPLLVQGFNKERLFEILDTLEVGTRDIMLKAREQLAASKGANALDPWNTGECPE
jgi:hypothetical protein